MRRGRDRGPAGAAGEISEDRVAAPARRGNGSPEPVRCQALVIKIGSALLVDRQTTAIARRVGLGLAEDVARLKAGERTWSIFRLDRVAGTPARQGVPPLEQAGRAAAGQISFWRAA